MRWEEEKRIRGKNRGCRRKIRKEKTKSMSRRTRYRGKLEKICIEVCVET